MPLLSAVPRECPPDSPRSVDEFLAKSFPILDSLLLLVLLLMISVSFWISPSHGRFLVLARIPFWEFVSSHTFLLMFRSPLRILGMACLLFQYCNSLICPYTQLSPIVVVRLVSPSSLVLLVVWSVFV